MLKLYFAAPNIRPFFEGLKTPLKDFTRPATGYPAGLWDALNSRVMADWVAQQIAGGGIGPGGSFAALSPKYETRKEKRWGSQPILVANGRLRTSFAAGGDHIFSQSPMGMRWGSGVEYGLYHQTGTRRMPTRRPLDPGPEQVAQLRTAMAQYVMRRYRDLGFAKVGRGATAGEAKAFGRAWFESGARAA